MTPAPPDERERQLETAAREYGRQLSFGDRASREQLLDIGIRPVDAAHRDRRSAPDAVAHRRARPAVEEVDEHLRGRNGVRGQASVKELSRAIVPVGVRA